MPKFSGKQPHVHTRVAITTTGDRLDTYEGLLGHIRDPQSELFLLAASNFVGENTFYEKAADRDVRFSSLVRVVTLRDPEWMQKFIPFLRGKMNMRTAAIVAACEYVRVEGAPNRSAVIDSACLRPDEPAEAIGYWLSTYGKPIPIALRRGVARAATRLYNERAALKWDGLSRGIRMADVIDLCHPKPKAAWQSSLFKYLLDRRHDRNLPASDYGLLTILENEIQRSYTKEQFLRRLLADAPMIDQSGMTWEQVSERVPDGMTAEVWEALIPYMKHMALIRNLRNFDQANVSIEAQAAVAEKIMSPTEVLGGRQLPIRYYSAWKHSGGTFFGHALDVALEYSVHNVPKLTGKTLVLIDQSGSMNGRVTPRSQVTWADTAALFGLAVARRSDESVIVPYGTFAAVWDEKGSSLLRQIEAMRAFAPQLGGGTNTARALEAAWAHSGGANRVIIVTDEQAARGTWPTITCPLYTFNVAGYRVAQTENGKDGKYAFGGLTDASFRLIDMLERRENGGWEALFE